MSFLSNLSVSVASLIATLAQEKGPEPAAPAPEPGAPPAGGGSGLNSIIFPMVVCFVVIYVIVMLPERKKQKARQAMIRGVKKGDRVITSAGIIGKAVRIDEKEVTLQVDKENDIRMQFLKSSIHEVIPEGTETPDPKDEGK